jgi:hypothetical protein
MWWTALPTIPHVGSVPDDSLGLPLRISLLLAGHACERSGGPRQPQGEAAKLLGSFL